MDTLFCWWKYGVYSTNSGESSTKYDSSKMHGTLGAMRGLSLSGARQLSLGMPTMMRISNTKKMTPVFLSWGRGFSGYPSGQKNGGSKKIKMQKVPASSQQSKPSNVASDPISSINSSARSMSPKDTTSPERSTVTPVENGINIADKVLTPAVVGFMPAAWVFGTYGGDLLNSSHLPPLFLGAVGTAIVTDQLRELAVVFRGKYLLKRQVEMAQKDILKSGLALGVGVAGMGFGISALPAERYVFMLGFLRFLRRCCFCC